MHQKRKLTRHDVSEEAAAWFLRVNPSQLILLLISAWSRSHVADCVVFTMGGNMWYRYHMYSPWHPIKTQNGEKLKLQTHQDSKLLQNPEVLFYCIVLLCESGENQPGRFL